MKSWILLLMALTGGIAGCGETGQSLLREPRPRITLDPTAAGATQVSGHAFNVDPNKIKVAVYARTNEWYVQPQSETPFTTISADGAWESSTHSWSTLEALLVDPVNYVPAAVKTTNPALDAGVLAWTEYRSTGPTSVDFSGRTWTVKVTEDGPKNQVGPGPNFWSNDPLVVHVAPDGLHLKIAQIDGVWRCGEIYLPQSLGYGIYTVEVNSRLDELDQNTVAAPLFLYAADNQELDNEYGGTHGIIPSPYDAQFVVQPYLVPGNLVRYLQPPVGQFTSQMEWRADRVTFSAWAGWSNVPAGDDIIYRWIYHGASIPLLENERAHINLWLWNGRPPANGAGDEMIVRSFSFQP